MLCRTLRWQRLARCSDPRRTERPRLRESLPGGVMEEEDQSRDQSRSREQRAAGGCSCHITPCTPPHIPLPASHTSPHDMPSGIYFVCCLRRDERRRRRARRKRAHKAKEAASAAAAAARAAASGTPGAPLVGRKSLTVQLEAAKNSGRIKRGVELGDGARPDYGRSTAVFGKLAADAAAGKAGKAGKAGDKKDVGGLHSASLKL